MPEPTALLHRFQSTVPYYARYRLGYPERLIARVAAGLAPGAAVLDLGAGPGLLALGFARLGMAVTAVDPEAAMLAAVEAAAAAEGLKIATRQGSSFALPDGIGPFRLVVIGRAFHWMDRVATLQALDSLVAPDGAIALFDDEHLKTAENRWRDSLDAVAAHYGAEAAPHRQARRDPTHRCHESILLDSPFSRLETFGEVVARDRSIDDIVGFARSLSVTSSEALGERSAAFEIELRQALAVLSPDGRFSEIAEMRALVARRR